MRRHEVGGEEEVEPTSLALVSVLAQWTSNSSAGPRCGKDGKSGNRLFVQMKRENQNPRCNPSFQPAIFFRSRSLTPHVHTYICVYTLTLSLLLFFILRIIQPSERSRRLLHPVCLRKVGAPQPEILRVKKLHSTQQYVTKKKKKMRRMRASEKNCNPVTS